MELSYDYDNKVTVKRTKNIFSVLSSSNRIEILKILNSKGPLAYSELKSYAGFKSKKESGKFAYHLRKLVKYSLISLNKNEKKYIITNLGKTILSLTRQIEDMSIIEGSKLYIRSIDGYEEFDTSKIAQLLIRNVGLPPDLANKISEEVESKILKAEPSYLTKSLLIDIINATLIEHNHEEWSNKLVRLGISSIELSKLLDKGNNIDDIKLELVSKIFAEYVLFSCYSKDIVDHHIEGNINIDTSGLSSITPDTLFIDGIKLDDKYSFIKFIKEVSKEVSKEIVVSNLDLKEYDIKDITKIFFLISNPHILLSLRLRDSIDNVLESYKAYLENVQLPRIGLIIEPDKISKDQLIDLLRLGGLICISKEDRSIRGIKKADPLPISIVIHSISINLPRLAYESNKHELYFRAQLSNTIRTAIEALRSKKEIVEKLINNKVLTTLNGLQDKSNIRTILNLIDPYTAIHDILEQEDVFTIMIKTIETAQDAIGKDHGLAIVSDESVHRFINLDLDKYGRSRNISKYNEGLTLDRYSVDHYITINKMLDGLSLFLNIEKEGMLNADIHFLPKVTMYICKRCNRKVSKNLCNYCNMPTTLISNIDSINIKPPVLK